MPADAIQRPVRDEILAWYDATGRVLPFRDSTDPYAILVSEVMAQQTQISRVGVAWRAWLEKFPTLPSLAAASPADVLRQWAGLGYNRRAIQLHRAARVMVAEHGGRVPDSVEALQALPGIGPYTARAVAAIAFGTAVGAVDTNVRRVIGRVVAGDVGLPATRLQEIADSAVPAERPAAWTHALMDVGAAFCRPRNPVCGACPAVRWCRYARTPRHTRARPRKRADARAKPGQPFTATTRWLRGRIVERLVVEDGWTALRGPIGEHSAEAVTRALTALRRDGIVELHPADGTLARLARA
jgi:A/G-specific adenine glycosylase